MRLAAEWQRYRALAVPRDAGKTQVRQTEAAFYAGASSLYDVIMHMLTPGTEPSEEDLRNMQALHDELGQFAARASYTDRPPKLALDVRYEVRHEAAEKMLNEIGQTLRVSKCSFPRATARASCGAGMKPMKKPGCSCGCSGA